MLQVVLVYVVQQKLDGNYIRGSSVVNVSNNSWDGIRHAVQKLYKLTKTKLIYGWAVNVLCCSWKETLYCNEIFSMQPIRERQKALICKHCRLKSSLCTLRTTCFAVQLISFIGSILPECIFCYKGNTFRTNCMQLYIHVHYMTLQCPVLYAVHSHDIACFQLSNGKSLYVVHCVARSQEFEKGKYKECQRRQAGWCCLSNIILDDSTGIY